MRRILYVDDDPRFLEDLRHMLRPQRNEWDVAFAPGVTLKPGTAC